jgi:hypothetical protein
MKKFRPFHSNVAHDLKDFAQLFCSGRGSNRACEQDAKRQQDRASYPDEDPHEFIERMFTLIASY